MTEPALHAAAARGFQAGAEVYEQARPGYPEAVRGWLCGRLRLEPGATVLDLGAGAGKLTPRLLETGAAVIAVEPVDAMRATLAAGFPQVRALAGTAQAIPLADSSVRAVVCGQAFHWFASPAALAEIRRVLQPGGALGLLWNARTETAPWATVLDALVRRYQGDAPRRETGVWLAVFPAAGYGPLDETVFDWTLSGPPERLLVQRMLSTSFIAALPEAERKAVAAEARRIVQAAPELAGRETVRLRYETRAYACDRMEETPRR
jgi:ubiquinone/menaquinone biosynthesis C-methylase UbiE